MGEGGGGGGSEGRWGRGRIQLANTVPSPGGRPCAAAIMANPALSSSLHRHINQSSATTGKGIESSPNWKGGELLDLYSSRNERIMT